MDNPIVLLPYDNRWPALFEEERTRLRAACGALLPDLHHIGSTSIPGLAAKPVIDILAVLERHEDGLSCVGPMRMLGYEYRGANGINGRHYFSKGAPHTHHVHMLAAGHPEIARHLGFRDYLRAHPDEARAYEALKRDLAARFRTDRRAYAAAKDAFCARIDRLVRGL
ncbi:GrpB family protein [Paenirhodobacter populi]|uniref:GrpB family protein n=1 Tax=Paenirhodobacter populi TaxID=2306993 RepID=A0A451GCM3_9RHOB|nr:GrpB family protein [Sinirhodobacter populi]RWR13110.1 GrpB family protein [Sinirhodobacter populi]